MEGIPQRRTFVCHSSVGSVVDETGAHPPDGAPGASAKCSPPHPLTLSIVQLDPIIWVAGEQLCVQFPSE